MVILSYSNIIRVASKKYCHLLFLWPAWHHKWLLLVMQKQISALYRLFIGNQEETSMEAGIFNQVSLFTIVALVISFTVNLTIHLPNVSLILFFTLALTIGLYVSARFYDNLKSSSAIFCFMLNMILVLNFYINSGSGGPTLMLFIVSFFLSMTIMPKKQYLFWISLNILTIIALLAAEYLYPLQISNSYSSRTDVFVDILITYLGSVSCILVILSYVVKSLVNEKNKVITITQDLHKANQSKTQLLAIISHDLRSPLNSIQSFLELLLEYDIDANEKRMIKARLLQETKNTQIMLQNLLTWSKAQMEGGVKASMTSVPLFAELKIVLEILHISALEKVITINNEINPNICITADTEMIKLIVRNLIVNAIKFTPSGGTITLKSQVHEQSVTLIIEDNGIGISSEKKQTLFSIAAESTYGTNNEKGVGLGLLLCKDFTEMQGGTIGFQSTLGKGSKFFLTFPLCPSSNNHKKDLALMSVYNL